MAYAIFEFKDKAPSNECPFSRTVNVQSSRKLSLSAIFLQIYNRTLMEWETLASNNTAEADTDINLTGSKSTGLTDYYDGSFEIACRVYQEAK